MQGKDEAKVKAEGKGTGKGRFEGHGTGQGKRGTLNTYRSLDRGNDELPH